MVKITPNANFYSLSKSSVHDQQVDEEYKEYRRCWIDYPQEFFLREFPMHLDIEITSRCNLKCTFCDKLPLLSKGQLGDMDFSLYKRIIDEGAKHRLWGVKLSYRGEPLLHRNIVEMVEYAKQKGVLDIYFNTNGMLLKEEMSKKLIDAGLDRVSVSVDGTDPVLFEKTRVGAKYDVILRNIDMLMELRHKMGVRIPRVRVQTVYFPDLDLDAYKDFWISRCDEVAAIDYKDESNRQEGLVYDWACPQLWQRMTVEWDGTVMPCNNDDFRLLSPGNVKEKSIYDCWHDAKVESARRLHKKGQSHEVKSCCCCPWRTTQINKLISQA